MDVTSLLGDLMDQLDPPPSDNDDDDYDDDKSLDPMDLHPDELGGGGGKLKTPQKTKRVPTETLYSIADN